ncbi:hypothetical protein Cgig2_032119 [Carnegiea gigantea]|uniref:Uncharacterized protein n=1 Tax=Carnegiea gigantea TaxID=171969 RepID=A0A9Q1QK76_9CARY|nr:hypothetical protein Cgig2_032119 [Carnegiea gigantea]
MNFLVHYIHAFIIHVTVLILLKGILFAHNSHLIPDKGNLRFHFPCDGPRRRGKYQVSAWDHIFLGIFWIYNAISIVSQIISDQEVATHITGGNLVQSSTSINGWLHDFLWAQASQAHNKLKVASATQPRALSIAQGRDLHNEILSHGVRDPLHVRPITHAIWDPHFDQSATEAFTRGDAPDPVNITYSGGLVIPATEMKTEHFVVQKCRISSQSSLVKTLWRGRLRREHEGLYDTINNSIHVQLGLVLASLGVINSLVALHMYSLPAYAFIAQDFTTQALLYTHHQYIIEFIMT